MDLLKVMDSINNSPDGESDQKRRVGIISGINNDGTVNMWLGTTQMRNVPTLSASLKPGDPALALVQKQSMVVLGVAGHAWNTIHPSVRISRATNFDIPEGYLHVRLHATGRNYDPGRVSATDGYAVIGSAQGNNLLTNTSSGGRVYRENGSFRYVWGQDQAYLRMPTTSNASAVFTFYNIDPWSPPDTTPFAYGVGGGMLSSGWVSWAGLGSNNVPMTRIRISHVNAGGNTMNWDVRIEGYR